VKLFRRTPPDPAAVAAARAAETEAEVARLRALAALRREQEAADREAARLAARAAAERARRARVAKLARRRLRRARLATAVATVRTVAPLLVVNAAAIGGQLAYAYSETPATWPTAVRAAVAIGVATAAESVALYVGWHAHDALLQGAHATAARLRRASYLIALIMAMVNYSHFAGGLLEPTALAVILGVLSSLSPWLWGLHTRRQQHVQLIREGLVDEGGAEFSAERKRAFPVRTWQARRWSIEHHERDPRRAWDGYHRERAARRAERQRQRARRPAGRIRAAVAVLRGQPVPGSPAAIAAAPMTDREREVCARIRGQVATAGQRLRAGIERIQQPAPVATSPATPDGQPVPALVATRPATVTVPVRPPTTATKVATGAGSRGRDVSERRALVLRIAAERPEATDGEIAAAAEVSVSTVRRALGRKKS